MTKEEAQEKARETAPRGFVFGVEGGGFGAQFDDEGALKPSNTTLNDDAAEER